MRRAATLPRLDPPEDKSVTTLYIGICSILNFFLNIYFTLDIITCTGNIGEKMLEKELRK